MTITKPAILALASLLGSGLCAEDTGYSFKLQGLAGTKSSDGQLNGLGFGVTKSMEYAGGQVAFELGYTSFGGKIMRADMPANSLGVSQTRSAFTKRNTTDLLGLRISYGRVLKTDWSWHAGLGLDHSKSRLETIGDFNDDVTKVSRGGWTTTPEKSFFTLVPFGGVTYRLSESGSIELNLSVWSYKLADVQAVVSGNYIVPQYGDKSVSDLKLEIAYVFHF